MESLVLFCLSVYYVTILLRLDSSDGPFASRTQTVRYIDNGQNWVRQVNAFDYLRRPFGAYKIGTNSDGAKIWVVTQGTAWVCSFCLSFWISLLFSCVVLYITRDTVSTFWHIFAGAGFVAAVERLV